MHWILRGNKKFNREITANLRLFQSAFEQPGPVFRSLQRCETTSSIDDRRKQVSKRALINFLNPQRSFPL